MVDLIFMHSPLKAIDDRVYADFSFNSSEGLLPELLQQLLPVKVEEGINNFISAAHVGIDGIEGTVKPFIQEEDTGRKARAVRDRDEPADSG